MNEAERLQWLEDRRKVIGGTDISGILGMNPWKSPLSVYLDKTGVGDGVVENEAMEWGKRLELLVAQKYAEAHDVTLEQGQFHTHQEIPYLGGTPDYIVLADSMGPIPPYGVEIKTASIMVKKEWGEPGTDEVPEHYLLQCLWYMMLTGTDRWDLAVLFGGNEYREYRIDRNQPLIDTMVDAGKSFWENHVLPGIPPEPQALDYEKANIRRLFAGKENDSMLVGDIEADKLAIQLQSVRATKDTIEKQESTLIAKLQARIGYNAGVAGEWGKIYWKMAKDSEKVDYKALVEEIRLSRPGLVEELLPKYTSVKAGSRAFRCYYK